MVLEIDGAFGWQENDAYMSTYTFAKQILHYDGPKK